MTTPCNVLPFRRHALALALAFAVGAANAATINVNGDCSLYNAINNANTDTDKDGVNGCPAGNGADTLNLPLNSTQLLVSGFGLPIIASVITINGNGSTVDGIGSFRPFDIVATGDLTLNRLTVKNGYADKGGGIHNKGKLAIVNSTVTGNGTYSICDYYCFGGYGGGIFNQGTATLTNSRVSNNSSDVGFSINGESGRGGGIFNSGSMTLTNSRVTHNKMLGSSDRGDGPSGGGVINYGAMTLSNSTVSGNSASNDGGGIRNRGIMTLEGSTVSRNNAGSGGGINNGPGHFIGSNSISLTLTNSTVSGNSAFSGGGIRNTKNLTLINTTLSGNRSVKKAGGGISNTGLLALTNSLVANSSSGSGDCINGGGAIVSLKGVNLIEDGSCGADISGDPKLGALLNNGGYTATHALQAGSDALDAANKTLCPVTDQRGVKRPQPAAGNCDVGAFERMTPLPSVVKSIVEFFDNEISGGGIVGTGQDGLVIQHSNALHNQLVSAGHYKSRNLSTEACAQLGRTLDQIDPNNTPDANDYVTGSEAGTLADKVKALRAAWTCK